MYVIPTKQFKEATLSVSRSRTSNILYTYFCFV